MSLLDRSFQLVENHVVICGLPSLGQYLLYESPSEKVDKWTMLKIRLSCRAVFIVVVSEAFLCTDKLFSWRSWYLGFHSSRLQKDVRVS